MKHAMVILLIFLVVLDLCTACESESPSSVTSTSQTQVSSTSNKPSFFEDIGKPYQTLMSEHPTATFQINNSGFPDAASIGLGEPGAKYNYFLFGTQYFPSEQLTDDEKNQLKCAGISTTVGVLFPQKRDEMSLDAFFSAIGVSDYKYYDSEIEDCRQGWIEFTYDNMDVNIDTTKDSLASDDAFHAITTMKSAYPVIIIKNDIDDQNNSVIENATKRLNDMPLSSDDSNS